MRHLINRLMAKLGYVPAAALDYLAKPGAIPLKIEIDSSQVSTALVLLQQVVDVAQQAEAAVQRLNVVAGTAPATGAAASGLSG
jgi:hypothetical protein